MAQRVRFSQNETFQIPKKESYLYEYMSPEITQIPPEKPELESYFFDEVERDDMQTSRLSVETLRACKELLKVDPSVYRLVGTIRHTNLALSRILHMRSRYAQILSKIEALSTGIQMSPRYLKKLLELKVAQKEVASAKGRLSEQHAIHSILLKLENAPRWCSIGNTDQNIQLRNVEIAARTGVTQAEMIIPSRLSQYIPSFFGSTFWQRIYFELFQKLCSRKTSSTESQTLPKTCLKSWLRCLDLRLERVDTFLKELAILTYNPNSKVQIIPTNSLECDQIYQTSSQSMFTDHEFPRLRLSIKVADSDLRKRTFINFSIQFDCSLLSWPQSFDTSKYKLFFEFVRPAILEKCIIKRITSILHNPTRLSLFSVLLSIRKTLEDIVE